MLRNGFDRKKAWETCRGSNTSLQAILALGKPAEPPRVRAFLISELAFARAQRIRREGMRARLCQRRERGRQSSSSGKNQNRDSFRGEKSGKESGPTFVALTCGTAAASVPALGIVIVDDVEGGLSGLLVDAVCGVLRVDESALRPTSSEAGAVSSLCPHDGRFVSMLDLERVLNVDAGL